MDNSALLLEALCFFLVLDFAFLWPFGLGIFFILLKRILQVCAARLHGRSFLRPHGRIPFGGVSSIFKGADSTSEGEVFVDDGVQWYAQCSLFSQAEVRMNARITVFTLSKAFPVHGRY